jgi:hypothetical protein
VIEIGIDLEVNATTVARPSIRHSRLHPHVDAMVVSLKTAVATDRSLLELTDLPLGWMAIRDNPQSPWQRSPQTKA